MSSLYVLIFVTVTKWICMVSAEEIINPFPLQTVSTVGLDESQLVAPIANKPTRENGLMPDRASAGDYVESQKLPNVTVDSLSKNVSKEPKKIVNCKLSLINSTIEERGSVMVEIVNNSRLVDLLVSDNEITTKETEANCMVVLFYSRLCPFSAMAGPHFNGFARSFPDIKMVALDAFKYHGVNTQYGIVGVPTIILFHNGRPIAKFNGTEYTVHAFVKFIKIYTALHEDVIVVHSQDFQGPVPSVVDKEIDYYLVLSWIFIILCCIFFVSRSCWWKLLIQMIKNNWRESTGQHEHIE